MARRKYILHEPPNDQTRDDFGQISYPKSTMNSSPTISKKVSARRSAFFCFSVDTFSRWINKFSLPMPIIPLLTSRKRRRRRRSEEKSVRHSYIRWGYFQHDSFYRHIWISPSSEEAGNTRTR